MPVPTLVSPPPTTPSTALDPSSTSGSAPTAAAPLPHDGRSLASVLHVLPWPDPVIDAKGHDPRSPYVERFWLGLLGPSTTWLLRRVASGLEAHPDGFELPLVETARALGLGTPSGRHAPFVRSIQRACQFKLARWHGDQLEVRRMLPPLSRGQVAKLPPSAQLAHQEWLDHELHLPAHEVQLRQARRLALSLLELGEELESAERWLVRWKYQPVVAHRAAAWAWAQHLAALAAGSTGAGAGTEGETPG